MTRATLLRLLAHPTALNGADVRALEELAEAFPYCQTAHLLLAKAAHDHGSMLAGQRLRRAATYATDRALLRQLLETPSAEPTLEPAIAAATVTRSAGLAEDFAELPPAPPAEASPAEPPYSLLLTDQPAQEIVPAPQAKTPSAPEAALLANEPATDATKLLLPPAALEVPNVPDASASHPEATTEPANEAYLVPPVAVETAEAPLSAELAVEVVESEPQFTVAELTAEASTANEVEPAPSEVAAGLAELSVAEATASPGELATAFDATEAPSEEVALSETVLPTETSQDATAPTPDAAADPDELPAEAPPIRLPAEAEAASQEFGLATAEPAEVTAYQLPELELDITVPLAPAVATPRLPAFSGVPDVAYAPDEGSRYGFCLVAVAEAGEPLVPAASLPPTGEFFLPDALLLAHLAAPPELPTSTTTDLINSFLQRATGAVRRRAISAAASPQSDLSVRSTRATPDLASESLASILARQGKVEQAIAVYERLMVKIPEKSAIFAAEIEALRPSA